MAVIDKPPYLLLKVRFEAGACARCQKPIGPGSLYVVGPPPTHVACPSKKGIERHD